MIPSETLLLILLAPAQTPLLDDPETSIIDSYAYLPAGKRDPFRAIEAPEPTRGTTPLERWDLEQLKLIAIVTGPGSPYAMLEDPRGRGHVVRRGTPVGKDQGRVVRIHEDQIVVRIDRLVDWTGRRTAVEIPLVIPKPALRDEEQD